MNEKTAGKITSLLEEVFADGVKQGRELERAEIVKSLSGPTRPTRARVANSANGNGEAAPKPPSAPAANGLETPIRMALSGLAEEHPDGIFPDAIASYVKQHHNADVSVALIRQTLRSMTLTGQARRLARGRYAAISMPPPPGSLFHQNPAQA